jgi:hypothetical protein
MAVVYANQAAAFADYQAYRDYEFNGGVAAAQTFIGAIQALVQFRADSVGNQGSTVAMTEANRALFAELDRARIYVNRANRVGGGVKTLGVDNSFRGLNPTIGNDPLEIPQ